MPEISAPARRFPLAGLRLREFGTTRSREAIAGLSMFLATAYVVVVVPSQLAEAGLPRAAVTTCVITVVILGTAAMGLFGNIPMVLAPGLGGVALVAYTLVLDGGVAYPTAMGMVFWSGVAFLILTLFGIRSLITRIIPTPIRLAIGPAIGIFITFVGFRSAGLVVAVRLALLGAVISRLSGRRSSGRTIVSGCAFAALAVAVAVLKVVLSH